jgi:NADH-quinone oxidoreductase subunit A
MDAVAATSDSLGAYAAIAITIVVVTFIAIAMLVVAHVIGPKRHGPVKDSAYESGMPILMDTQRRFNVRFYMVAMLFLLFDVEIIFMWPWARVFYDAAVHGTTIPIEGMAAAGKDFLLGGMAIFFVLLVFGLVYEWKKGALTWD